VQTKTFNDKLRNLVNTVSETINTHTHVHTYQNRFRSYF